MFGKKYKKSFDKAFEQVLSLDYDVRRVCSTFTFASVRLVLFTCAFALFAAEGIGNLIRAIISLLEAIKILH